MDKLSIQVFLIFLVSLLMGCQPDYKEAYKTDQIYLFLQSEVGKVTKSIADLDKSFAELEKPAADDEASLLTMKAAAYRRSSAAYKKQRSMLEQERIYLEMKLRTRAYNVSKRAMQGKEIDGEAELSVFTARFPASGSVSGTP